MKTAITAILLLFVATSVGFLLIGEAGNSAQNADIAQARDALDSIPGVAGNENARVAAYYFHGTMRCPTCLKIERLARESIAATFAVELKTGLIEWKSIDYDEPSNGHFVQDYALSASALVLVRPDRTPAWHKLDKTWDLVDDEGAFNAYVVDAVSGLLRGEQ